MPNTKSAKKALRVSERKAVFNRVRKNKLKRSLKEFRRSLDSTLEKSQTALSKVFSDLDRVAKNNTIKKQTASRKKSRLTALFKKTFDQFEGSKQNKDAVATKVKTKAPAKKATTTAKKTTATAKKAPAKKPATKTTAKKKAE
jgi:ribosomal protein S20